MELGHLVPMKALRELDRRVSIRREADLCPHINPRKKEHHGYMGKQGKIKIVKKKKARRERQMGTQ